MAEDADIMTDSIWKGFKGTLKSSIYGAAERSRLAEKTLRSLRGVEPADTFLVSYPRSGNTWIRYILAQLHPSVIKGGQGEADVTRVIPDPAKNDPWKTAPRPRLIKSHLLYTPLYPKVVYLVRDGRDSMYSYYKYRRKRGFPEISFFDFLSMEHLWPAHWHRHVESWTAQNHVPFLLVRYEDVRENPKGEIGRILQFLGWSATEGDIIAAIEKSSLEKMQAVETKGGLDLNFVGKGQNYHDNYSDEEMELFLSYAGETLRKMGYL